MGTSAERDWRRLKADIFQPLPPDLRKLRQVITGRGETRQTHPRSTNTFSKGNTHQSIFKHAQLFTCEWNSISGAHKRGDLDL